MSEQFSLFDFDETRETETKNTPAIKETEKEKKFFVSCGLFSEKIFFQKKNRFYQMNTGKKKSLFF